MTWIVAIILCSFLRNSLSTPVHVNSPVLSISNNSLEAIGIANKINQFFNSQDSTIEDVKVVPFSSNNNVNGFSPFQDKSVVTLNLNLNVEIENGKPQKLTLPQGDLVLMFFPSQNQVNQHQVQEFMEATSSETSIANTPNGGVLFMSWANSGDEKPMIKRSSNPQARSDSLSTVMSNDDDLNRILESAEHESIADGDKNAINEDVKQVHEVIIKDDTIKKQWDNGRIPHFPVIFSFSTQFNVEVAKTFPHLNFFREIILL